MYLLRSSLHPTLRRMELILPPPLLLLPSLLLSLLTFVHPVGGLIIFLMSIQNVRMKDVPTKELHVSIVW